MIKDFETYISEGRMGRLVNADDSVRKQDELTEEEVRSYIIEKYKHYCKKITIRYEGTQPIVDIVGSFYIIEDITEIPFQFGEVTKCFVCYDCKNLTSLAGCPKKVGDDFDCSGCPDLTSLEGCPEDVGGYFNCSGCENLTTLKGCPKVVGGTFFCSKCEKLTSLEGCPKEVGGGFDCSQCPNLTSLDGFPEEVRHSFSCSQCPNLTSLEGCPKKVGDNFYCHSCGKKFTEEYVSSLCNVKGDVFV